MNYIKMYEVYYRKNSIWEWQMFEAYDYFYNAIDMKRKLIAVFRKDNVKMKKVKHILRKGY